MIVRKITYQDYMAKHEEYEIPTANDAGPIGEDEWNATYGGAVMLPYANGLPKDYSIKDGQILNADGEPATVDGVPVNGTWSFEEMEGDEAKKAIASTQERMQAIVTTSEEADSNIQPRDTEKRSNAVNPK